jgi:hypothetical protein
MISWQQAFATALRSGSAAAVLSAAMLALCGKVERNAPAGPLNGPSQWIWGPRAARHRRARLRETAVGYAIHHGVSIGWATLHEKYIASRFDNRSLPEQLLAGATTASIACFMDYGVARGRLQPGFEKHLGRKSLLLVYVAFALGLAIGNKRRTRR